MRILWLTYDLPYPLNSGGKIRAYYLIKHLAVRNKITLFSYYREEGQKKYVGELEKFCQKIILFRRRPVWCWQNLILSLNPKLPFAAATYFSPPLKAALKKELINGDYDLVHFESFYPALYLPLAKKLGVKTLMGNENIEYQVYARYASQKPPIFRQLLELEVFRMRLFEEELWRLADINIAVSTQDAVTIEGITKKNCSVIPNGVDSSSFTVKKVTPKSYKLIFIGSLTYQANIDAVRYFLEKIYPLVKKQVFKAEFLLVSWHKPSWFNKYCQDSSIRLIQDKERTTAELFQPADILVAPIRIAGGTRIKILEAMAAGLPVVTTSVGIEGIEAKNEEEVVIADEPENFAGRVVELLNNSRRRRELGLAGRRLVTENYNWLKIAEKLNKVYEKIA